MGDEIQKVAIVWVAAGLIGLDTGYLTAVQAAAIFVFSLVGGAWADNWDHRRTMIGVDIARGACVLILPLAAYFAPPSLSLLVFVVIVTASLSAFFDPALRAVIPRLTSDRETLQATNGLMEFTVRLARVIGPGLIALLNSAIPVIHFFTLNAVSFLLSALSLKNLRSALPHERPAEPPAKCSSAQKIRLELGRAVQLAQLNPLLRFFLVSNGFVSAAWTLVFPLSLGLLVHERMPHDVGALGLIVAAYGVGNVCSNIIAGSMEIHRPALFVSTGRCLTGVGFLLLGLAPTFPMMMLAAALSATGGPATDLAFLSVLQRDFRGRDIAKIYRLTMALSYGCLFVVLMLSPLLYRLLTIPTVISLSGIFIGSFGVFGFMRFSRQPALQH